MKLLILGALVAAAGLHAEKTESILRSQWVLVAASAGDVASSWGGRELNPVLGRGAFGPRQMGVEVGLTAGVLLFERLAIKKWPRSAHVLRWVNYGATVGHVAATTNNLRLR